MNREQSFQALTQREPWDVLVIGGGASGLGAAVDAAARGYRTALVEQDDFAKGTSSRSTKLIHGGVRYLKQGDIPLVRESLRERGRLRHNAPHLVHPLAFILPCHNRWESFYYGVGLKLYDLLSGRWSFGPSRLISHQEALRELPALDGDKFRAAVRYFDGQFDDTRLAVCLAQTLHDLGGTALNYARVTKLLKSGERVTGAIVQDEEGGRELEVRAAAVINATGVFTDAVRRMDEPDAAALVAASQGTHLVVDREFLPAQSALMVPTTTDGRVLFAIPWHGHTVIGTTDLPVTTPAREPCPMEEEVEFILTNAARYLRRTPRREEILSVFAGLRPLVKSGAVQTTAKLSRGHTVAVSRSGLVTLTGGKWTTYRQMAEDAVNQAVLAGGLESRPPGTAGLLLHGAKEFDPARVGRESAHWAVHGNDAEQLAALSKQEPALGRRLHSRLPYQGVEVVWAARQEMARTVEDVLARRTRALFLDARAAMEMAPAVASILRRELGRDSGWELRQVEDFARLARGYLPPGTA